MSIYLIWNTLQNNEDNDDRLIRLYLPEKTWVGSCLSSPANKLSF